MDLIHSGKIRDLYRDGDDIILVASDKVSVYDYVLPTPIPDKGMLLTALSLWWFDRLSDVVPNHVISAEDVPPQFAGRAIRCQRLDMIEVECVARGYLSGEGLKEYEKHGSVSGVKLPSGLVNGSRLPEPIFTPATKASGGAHDEYITFDEMAERVGAELAHRLRDLTLQIYRRGAEIGLAKGLIIADTKLEFGLAADGELVLADEVLTSDSSRFWEASEWRPGGPLRGFDKQFVRDWAAGTGWDKESPAPQIPDDIVAATKARYVEAYERLTGNTWSS